MSGPLPLLLEPFNRRAAPQYPLTFRWIMAEEVEVVNAFWCMTYLIPFLILFSGLRQGCLRFVNHTCSDAEARTEVPT